MDLYLETFDAAAMVHEVASTIQPLVDKRGNRLEVEVAEGPAADARRPDEGAAEPVQPALQRVQIHRERPRRAARRAATRPKDARGSYSASATPASA